MFMTSAAWARVPRVNPITLELTAAPLAGPLVATAAGLTAPAAEYRVALFMHTAAGELCPAGNVALNATGAPAGAATATLPAPAAGAATATTPLLAALYPASYAVPPATCYAAGPAGALLPPPFPWIAASAEVVRTATASPSATPSVTPSGTGTPPLPVSALPTPSPANIAGAGANGTTTPVVTGSLTPDGASASVLSGGAAVLAAALAAVAAVVVAA
jgi:hypothetical protein